MNDLNLFGEDSKERVENAVKKIQQGFGILLVDDEDRENEGYYFFCRESFGKRYCFNDS